jgi:hypothetical protein
VSQVVKTDELPNDVTNRISKGRCYRHANIGWNANDELTFKLTEVPARASERNTVRECDSQFVEDRAHAALACVADIGSHDVNDGLLEFW